MGSFSIWHWIVVLLVLSVPGTLIYIAVSRARAENGSMTPGFKGWLFMLAAAQWIGLLRALLLFVQTATDSSEGYRRFPLLHLTDIAIVGAVLLFAGLVIVLMLKRSRRFPSAFLCLCALAVLSLPLSLTMAVAVLNSAYGVPVTLAQAFQSSPVGLPAWIGSAIGVALWAVYVSRSRRVAMTFVN